MNKKILSLAFLGLSSLVNAQTWTKLFNTPDSMYAQSVNYFNMGDTVTFHGGSVTNIFSKNSYISTDAGQNFSFDNTQLDVTIKPSMFSSLRVNKKLIGYQNAPNIGSYLFNGTGNWTTLLTNAEGTGTFFETGLNQTFVQIENYISPIDFSNPVFNPTFTLTETFNIVSYLNVGTRTIFGLANGEIKYVENGNFNAIQTATVNNSAVGTNKFVYRIWKAGANLFAVINADYQQLFKSTDNGSTWDLVTTARSDSQFEPNLLSTFINGTSDGRIYFINKTSPDDKLYISNDGGLNAVAIALPSEINTNTYDLNKILVNGNKVWMDVKAFNESDFISTNSAVAGLYALENEISNTKENTQNLMVISPNPTVSTLNISFEANSADVKIYSLVGDLVLNKKIDKNYNSINVNDLKTGTYIIHINVDDKTTISKFIKQ